MAEPSMDEILRAGRARQKGLELGLGIVILLGGAVWRFAMTDLTHASRYASYFSYGVMGIGGLLIAHGLFGDGRGREL